MIICLRNDLFVESKRLRLINVGPLGCAVNYRLFLLVVLRTQGMGSDVYSCLLDCVIVDIERTVLLTN